MNTIELVAQYLAQHKINTKVHQADPTELTLYHNVTPTNYINILFHNTPTITIQYMVQYTQIIDYRATPYSLQSASLNVHLADPNSLDQLTNFIKQCQHSNSSNTTSHKITSTPTK